MSAKFMFQLCMTLSVIKIMARVKMQQQFSENIVWLRNVDKNRTKNSHFSIFINLCLNFRLFLVSFGISIYVTFSAKLRLSHD